MLTMSPSAMQEKYAIVSDHFDVCIQSWLLRRRSLPIHHLAEHLQKQKIVEDWNGNERS